MVTVITKTIGSGKDYASFTLAEADVPNIVGSRDLVGQDKAVVFEADAGTYNESVTFDGTLGADATRNVTYKPAAGSEHGGVLDGGVLITQTSSPSNFTLRVIDNFTHLSGLGVQSIGTTRAIDAYSHGYIIDSCVIQVASTVERCIFVSWNPTAVPSGAVNTISNNVFINGFVSLWHGGGSAGVVFDLINNTHVGLVPQRNWDIYHVVDTTYNLVNNLVLNPATSGFGTWLDQGGGGVATITGSNNFGGSFGPFPAAIQGSPYPITASQSADPGAGDYALYVGKNGALLDSPNNDVIGQGVGPAANSDVPLYDILGNFRAGDTANPGAFEIPQATYTWKKTIGPVGRDYASFTLAEADVTNIPTSTDLVNDNEAIVFEADAGTYSEFVYFGSALTTDATRNVTYKPAAGSEHGGVPGAGVVINASGFMSLRDDYMLFDGMEVNGSSTQTFNIALVTGATLRNCIVDAATQGLVIGSDAVDIAVENCVLSSNNYTIYPNASSGTVSVSVRNCTVKPFSSTLSAIRIAQSGTATINAEFVNCLVLEGSNGTYIATGTTTVTGSNNFGGGAFPFPVALQGSPYPITATTDTDPGPGDWAIYDAATGALINDSDNDVLAGGVGPSANSDVPETDIVGNLRSGSTADPGAFEISSIPAPLPGLSSDMQQTYQAEAAYTLALTPSGVTNVTHQTLGADDYLRVNNSTRSREVKFPDGVQAVRVVALADQKPCSVTVVLDDGAGGETESDIGYVGGGVIQAESPYLWNLSALQSDGTYPKLKFTREGEWIGNQDIYVWWHTS